MASAAWVAPALFAATGCCLRLARARGLHAHADQVSLVAGAVEPMDHAAYQLPLCCVQVICVNREPAAGARLPGVRREALRFQSNLLTEPRLVLNPATQLCEVVKAKQIRIDGDFRSWRQRLARRWCVSAGAAAGRTRVCCGSRRQPGSRLPRLGWGIGRSAAPAGPARTQEALGCLQMLRADRAGKRQRASLLYAQVCSSSLRSILYVTRVREPLVTASQCGFPSVSGELPFATPTPLFHPLSLLLRQYHTTCPSSPPAVRSHSLREQSLSPSPSLSLSLRPRGNPLARLLLLS